MNIDAYRDQSLINEILITSKVIAVVGISDREDRPSYGVAEYLEKFYQIIPVNPKLQTWKGRPCYPSITKIPSSIKVDLVDVFRRSEDVLPIVEDCIARPVRFIWLQQGIYNEEAGRRAAQSSIGIIMNACLAVEHARS